MVIAPRLPEDAPKGYGGCTCDCHKFPRGMVMHVMACCWPGKKSIFDFTPEIEKKEKNDLP